MTQTSPRRLSRAGAPAPRALRLPVSVSVLALSLALAGCVPPGAPKPGQTPPSQAAAAVNDVLTDPDVDPETARVQPALIDGLVTLSIGDSPLFESAPEAGFKALEVFLRSEDGRASAGLGGEASAVTIVETRQVADTLYVLVEDKGRNAVPILGERFWRAFTEINQRATIASLGVFDSSSMRDGAKLGHLARVVTALKEGNGDVTDAAEQRLAATAPAASPAPVAAPDAPPKPGVKAVARGPVDTPPRSRPGS